MGRDLGYEGKDLQDFVQQQDYERAEIHAEKELERNQLDAEEAKIAQQEKDREIELAKIAAEEATERAKIVAQEADIGADRDVEMARIDSIAEQAEKDRDLKRTELESNEESKLASEIEIETLKHSFEMKPLMLTRQLQMQTASFKTELEQQTSEKLAHARDSKLPHLSLNIFYYILHNTTREQT